MNRHLTTTTPSSTLLPRATELARQIADRDPDAVERQVAALMLTFRDKSGDEDARTIARAYRAALADLSTPAVLAAIDRFARGKIDRNHAFAPSTAEIHVEAARIESAMRDELQRLRPAPIQIASEPEVSPEERARVGRGFTRLLDYLAKGIPIPEDYAVLMRPDPKDAA